MAKMKDHISTERVKIIVCGDSGMGKTSLLATLANNGYNLAIADFNNGLDILKEYLTKEGMERVNYVTLEDDVKNRRSAWGQFCTLTETGWEDLGKIQDWDNSWVLVIDDGTSAGSAAMRAALSKAGKAIDVQPSLPDYGEAGRLLYNKLIPLLSNNLKFHLVINTHLKEELDDFGRTRYKPAFVGAYCSQEIPKMMNNIVRIDAKPNGDRVLRTASDNKMALKISCPSKVEKEEPFDLAALFNKIMGK